MKAYTFILFSFAVSLTAQQIPNLCGAERLIRRDYWRMQDGEFFGHRADTAWRNDHPYSCQEQLIINDTIFALYHASKPAYMNLGTDSAYYAVMCQKPETLGYPYPGRCWSGGWLVRKYAIRNGQLYDTLLVFRKIPANPPRLVKDTLIRP